MNRLPETFLYGATIGAHQVEGNDFDSDWWRWEQRASRIRDGRTSVRGAGHLERYNADYALARKLGHNAVCLSFSWPRLQPGPDAFDERALSHYREVLERAAAHGLTPLCIMHQVATPAWFSDRGGWRAPDAASCFETYAQRVAGALGGCCGLWLPVYEPEHWLTLACREGCWPGGGDIGRRADRDALRQLARAHVLAARALREHAPGAQVGVSVRGATVEPLDPHSPWDMRAAQREQQRLNMRYLDAVAGAATSGEAPVDFIGLSYFGRLRVRFAPLYWRGGCVLPVDASGRPGSVDDAEACVVGFEELLSWFSRLNKPIYLSGLGVDTDDDQERCRFLAGHADALLRMMSGLEGGLDVRAWFHAALLDGFEWHHGYARRYGLVHVQQPGLARTPRLSAWLFKDIAEHGRVRPGSERRFIEA